MVGQGEEAIKELSAVKTNKKKIIIASYTCFRSATILTSKIITELPENHSEFSGWAHNQWRCQPENSGGQKGLRGKMFDVWRITLFCLEKRLSKNKMTIFSENLGGHGPFRPPWLHLCA